jgi:hypothetical protein
MTLRFAPDGTILVDYAGQKRGSVKSEAIAKALLINWFGDDPVSEDIKEGAVQHLLNVIQ